VAQSAATDGLYIGLDVGTQSTKGILLDVSRRGPDAVVRRAAKHYGLIEGLPAGAAEQHPHTWRDAVAAVVQELVSGLDKSKIRGIGVSGQQHGCVVLDGDKQVIRPAKLWCDTATADEAAELSARAGVSIPSGFTLPKVLWLKRKEPANFARIKHVLLPHDYINFLMSGKLFMEAGDASGFGGFRPKEREFDTGLLEWVDPQLPSWLPGFVKADAPAATVSKTGSEWLGIPEGTAIAPGGGDNMLSAIGSGATKAGVAVVSLGTSGTAFAYAATPIVDPKGQIAAFCDSTGAWMPLLCTMNVTGVTEEVRNSFGLDHAAITKLAADVPAGSGGVTFLPYLVGERVPNLPHATGALLGLRPGTLTAGHLFRAAIEGTTLGLASGIRRMQQLGLQVDDVRVVGGGSKNPLWRQILADVLGANVRALVEPESAALGGALQALWTVSKAAGLNVTASEVSEPFVELSSEVTKPNPANTAVYHKQLAEFEAATRTLYGEG
jgi:xylulokinase